MQDVVIHIGPHKTGTSALQSAFFRNAERLAERGLLYRPMGKVWNNHHVLAVQFSSTGGSPEAGRAFIERLLEDAYRGNQRVLISSEMLCESHVDVASFLSAFGPAAIRTVGYVRNPCDLMVSAYNQVVRDPKSRRVQPIEASPPPYDVSMANILRIWMDDGRLTLCPYDAAQWAGGTILSDFLTMLGVDATGLDPDESPDSPPTAENRSLPYLFVEAVRHLNAAGIDEDSRQKVIDILYGASADADKSYVLDRAMCDTCIEAMRAQLPAYEPFLRDGFQTDYLLRAPEGLLDPGGREAALQAS